MPTQISPSSRRAFGDRQRTLSRLPWRPRGAGFSLLAPRGGAIRSSSRSVPSVEAVHLTAPPHATRSSSNLSYAAAAPARRCPRPLAGAHRVSFPSTTRRRPVARRKAGELIPRSDGPHPAPHGGYSDSSSTTWTWLCASPSAFDDDATIGAHLQGRHQHDPPRLEDDEEVHASLYLRRRPWPSGRMPVPMPIADAPVKPGRGRAGRPARFSEGCAGDERLLRRPPHALQGVDLTLPGGRPVPFVRPQRDGQDDASAKSHHGPSSPPPGFHSRLMGPGDAAAAPPPRSHGWGSAYVPPGPPALASPLHGRRSTFGLASAWPTEGPVGPSMRVYATFPRLAEHGAATGGGQLSGGGGGRRGQQIAPPHLPRAPPQPEAPR